MGLETANFISNLVATNPTGADLKLQGDDHIRLIKQVLQATFPNANRAIRGVTVQNSAFADSPVTVAVTDEQKLFIVSAVDGDVTMALPSGGSLFAGFQLSFIKIDTSGNSVILNGDGAETINSGATYTLGRRFEAVTITWTGAQWVVTTHAEDDGVMYLTGSQTVSGNKTFTGDYTIKNNDPGQNYENENGTANARVVRIGWESGEDFAFQLRNDAGGLVQNFMKFTPSLTGISSYVFRVNAVDTLTLNTADGAICNSNLRVVDRLIVGNYNNGGFGSGSPVSDGFGMRVGNNDGRVTFQVPNSTLNGDPMLRGFKGNTQTWEIEANGDFLGSGSFGTLSDLRAKSIDGPADEDIDDYLDELGIYTGHYLDDPFQTKCHFFIAQELEALQPTYVTENSEGVKYILHDKMFPDMVKRLQKQQRTINDLNRKVELLMDAVISLERRLHDAQS